MSIAPEYAKTVNEPILDLVHDVGSAPSFQAALAHLVEHARALVPSDGTSVLWLNGSQIEVLARSGSSAPLQGLVLPASQVGAAQAVLDSRRPVAVVDTSRDLRWQRVPGEEKVRSWLGLPLLVQDQILGVMEWTSETQSVWEQPCIDQAIQISRCSAPILHQAQLLEDTRQILRKHVNRSTPTQTQPLSARLEPLVQEARDTTGAQHAFVFLLDKHKKRLYCAAASSPQQERMHQLILRGDGSLGGWDATLPHATEWLSGGPSDRDRMAKLGIDNTLILPLRANGSQVGMLGIGSRRRRGQIFGLDAIRLMTHLASQASIMVERMVQPQSDDETYDFENVVRSAPLGTGLLDMSGRIMFCNQAFAALLPGPDRMLEGVSLCDLLLPSDAELLTQALEDVTVSDRVRQVDVRLHSSQGGLRHLRISLSAATPPYESEQSVVTVMEDITALKILEQERQDHLRELGEKHDQLKELDEMKSRFVSNVSHELRTPLAVIKLYATLAHKGRPDKRLHYLQTIEQETHRLETLVENVLDLGRMDREALRINPEWVVVEDIVSQVVQVYSERAKKRDIKLHNRVGDDLPVLWADTSHLIQMLTNLVDNAIKYTQPGGLVWVSAQVNESIPHDILEIAVGDTGLGIPDEELDKVFDRFYRASNNTPNLKGTGLGLAIVQELMAQHDGSVQVTSELGKGSVFSLHFPLDRQDIEDD